METFVVCIVISLFTAGGSLLIATTVDRDRIPYFKERPAQAHALVQPGRGPAPTPGPSMNRAQDRPQGE